MDGPFPSSIHPPPHVLLSKPGRVLLSLDVVVPLGAASGTETMTIPASKGAVSRLALIVPRQDIDVTVTGGVLAERPATAAGRWVAFARPAQPLTVAWKRRVQDPRATQTLKWRGIVTEWVGLGEETSPLNATVRVEVLQGLAPSVDVAIPDGVIVNQVSGAMVSDWDFRPGSLKVTFLEPISVQAAFSLAAEARVPRDGAIGIPLVRLPAAERESGGVAVEVLGAGEISDRKPRGLDPADPSELGEPVIGRDSPSMQAFKFRAQPAAAARDLTLTVARYTPQAVLVATIEEARYDALLEEEGKTLVRARYAVRNNQRAFLGVTPAAGGDTLERRRREQAAASRRGVRRRHAAAPRERTSGRRDTSVRRRTDLRAARRVVGRQGPDDAGVAERGSAGRAYRRHPPSLAAFQRVARAGSVSPECRSRSLHGDAARGARLCRDEPASGRSAGAGRTQAADSAGDLIEQYRKDAGGRAIAGPLPLTVPFPQFGASVFLMSELTAELTAPTLEFSYKREIRW